MENQEDQDAVIATQQESIVGAQSPPRLARLTKRSPPRDVEEVATRASGRRESFLQERKDRLAQRRLKHGQVLARGRVDVPAKLEALRESLSAAQAARSAIYARIAATGSKEVAKVQFVVQQNKEKLRLERETKQLALELKLAEAEKRREAVLHTRRYGRRSISPRASSPVADAMDCDQALSAPKTPELAVLQLQRWWRKTVITRRAKDYVALHLDHSTVEEIPFEVIADVIKGKDVLDCASKLLATMKLTDKSRSRCRIFLSTYMLVGHPSAILMHRGQLEEQLVKSAKHFAALFTRWLRLSARGITSCIAPVQSAWQHYSASFQDWRRADSANLLEIMVAQYCELDLIYQIVKMDSDPIVAAEYHAAIMDNQLLLLTRIRGIAGDNTRKLIKSAVLTARRKRLPRKSTSAVSQTSSTQDSHNSTVSTADAVQFFSLGQRQTRLSNRQLIHELALNSKYQITRPTAKSEESAREAAMKQNFFTSLQAEMRQQKSSSWIPIVVQECKMRLLRLVMPDSRVFKAITDAFDIPTVEAECKQNSYDYLNFTNLVIEIMQQLCSPARDTLVSDIRLLQGNDTIDLFAKRVDSIFEVLDILLLDSANFHLSMSANRLIPEAVPYEQKLFREDVESGKSTLEKTTLWLNHSKSLLASEVSWNENADVLAVFQHAMGLLCTSQDGNIPETMHLDLARLSSYRAQASRIVMIAAHMMTAKNLMREKSRYLDPTTWTVMRERLSILIDEQADDSDATSIAAEINAILDRHYTVGLEADRDERHVTMTHLIVKNTITHPVRKLFTRRLQGLLADTLSGTSITASKIASLGLEDLRLPIETLLTQFEIFARLNWTYYHSWYAQILQHQER